MMVTQKTLKEIRNDLDSSFSTFSSSWSVTSFVEKEMKRHYLTAGFYTDERCSLVYKAAVEHLENEVNSEYNRIAKQINEYIDDLEESFEANHNYGSSDADTFTHVAIGAGAGLGAAILLGGPVGWMVGIGAGIAALYNSNEKKKELINKILNIADKLNGEAIKKLSDVLDLYIVEDEVLLPPTEIEDLFVEEETVEDLTPAQLEIKQFLENRGIKYLVHFTDKSSIASIRENGICSRKEGKRRGIKIRVNDNDVSAHKADKYMKSTSDDYISLTITTINEKVLSAYKARKGIRNAKCILIDASILWKEIDRDRIYCNMNASSSSLSCGNDIKALEAMFAPSVEQVKFSGERTVDTRSGKPKNVPTHKQAEILFQSYIDPKYFLNSDELEDDSNDDYEFSSSDLPNDDLPF